MTNTVSSEQSVTAVSQRMDPEKKAAWVAALRSGKYKQCRGHLFYGNRFCCLGVYGDTRDLPRDMLRTHAGSLGFAVSSAPDALKYVLSEIGSEAMRDQLASMNDAGKSFPEIADYIEENL